jgi:hypothetical protein
MTDQLTPDPRPLWVDGPDPVDTDNGDHGVAQVDDEGVPISQIADLDYGDAEGDPGAGALIAQFRRRLGIVEIPRNSNRTPIGAEFGWNGVAWCAETDVVCLIDAGYHGVPHNASAQGLHDALLHLPGFQSVSKAQAKTDDLVFYDWTGDGHIDHTGCCEGRKASGELVCIEGNTAGPDGNGGVYRKVRALSLVAAVVRPPVSAPPAPKPAPAPTLKHVTATVNGGHAASAVLYRADRRTPILTMPHGTPVSVLGKASRGFTPVRAHLRKGVTSVGWVESGHIG